MAGYYYLKRVTNPSNYRPVGTSEWRPVSVWRWQPELHGLTPASAVAVFGTFIATTDPDTVGEVRLRVAESGATSAIHEIDGPSGVVQIKYTDLAFTDSAENEGETSVILEARRTDGEGGVRVMTSAATAADGEIASSKPEFTILPAIDGLPYEGNTLTVEYSVAGYPTPTVIVQWLLDGSPVAPENGGNDEELTILAGWTGRVSVMVTATNSVDVAVEISDETEPIDAPPAPTVGAVTVNGAGHEGVADLSGDVTVAADFSSDELTDYAAEVAIRIQAVGDASPSWVDIDGETVSGSEVWNVVTDGSTSHTVPAGIFSNGFDYDVSVNYRNRFGQESGYASNARVTGSAAPVFTVLYPSGSTDSLTPVLRGDFSDAEGDTQDARRWKVYDYNTAEEFGYSGQSGFDPEFLPSPVWDSGWLTGADVADEIPVTLADGVRYVVFGQAEANDVRSVWSAAEFEVTVPQPAAPLLEATVDGSDVELVVTSTANQLDEDAALGADSTGVGAWTAGNADTDVSFVNGRMVVEALDAADLEVELDGLTVVAGEEHAFYADVRLDEGAARSWRVEIDWLDVSDAVISTTVGATIAEPSTAPEPDPDPGPAPSRVFTIQRAPSTAFASVEALAGSVVDSGVAVRLQPQDTAVNALITDVTWYVRSTTGGSLTQYGTPDTAAPWTMGTVLVPVSTWGTSGQKLVRATIRYADGSSQNVEASFTYEGLTEPPPTGSGIFWTRNRLDDLFIDPFVSSLQDPDSIWRRPVGTNAQLVASGIYSHHDGNQGWSDEPMNLIRGRSSDPVVQVQGLAGWGDRCSGNGQNKGTVRVRNGWNKAGEVFYCKAGGTSNNNTAFLRPDGRTMDHMGAVARGESTPAGPLFGNGPNPAGDDRQPISGKLYADNADGSTRLDGRGHSGMHGATNLYGMPIYAHEGPGGNEINHALTIVWQVFFNAHMNMSRPNGTGQLFGRGYRWPARRADSYAQELILPPNQDGNDLAPGYTLPSPVSNGRYYRYSGKVPACVMGSLLVLKKSQTYASLNVTTEMGRKIFRALQNYGAYPVDDAGNKGKWNHGMVSVERWNDGPVSASWLNSQVSDEIDRMMQATFVVDNNLPGQTCSGGGDPVGPNLHAPYL